MKRVIPLLILLTFPLTSLGQNRQGKRRGVFLGGLAGAAIGAAIGDKGDNETAGALIGGAIGAVTGGSIGSQYDQQRTASAYQPYPDSQPRRTPLYGQYYGGKPSTGYSLPPLLEGTRSATRSQELNKRAFTTNRRTDLGNARGKTTGESGPLPSKRPQGSVTIQDLQSLLASGVSERVLLNQIQAQGLVRPLTVSEIISLHQQGYSRELIEQIQKYSTANIERPISQATDRATKQRLVLPPPPQLNER
ncbi:MAG: glycine zipper domain-containing protein [Rubripirellula sp.]|nr:glycine zipper domain-containing protein [Rubripirellula sp.]